MLTSQPIPSLQALEKRDVLFGFGNSAPYGLGALAVDLLVQAHGSGSLKTYFEQAASHDSPTAFKVAFNEDIGSFYARFEQYRQNGFK